MTREDVTANPLAALNALSGSKPVSRVAPVIFDTEQPSGKGKKDKKDKKGNKGKGNGKGNKRQPVKLSSTTSQASVDLCHTTIDLSCPALHMEMVGKLKKKLAAGQISQNEYNLMKGRLEDHL